MSDLRDAIEEMAAVERDLRKAMLDRETTTEARLYLTDLRQRFGRMIKIVSALIDEDDQLKDDPELGQEFRRRFSEMRARVARFQEQWPPFIFGVPGHGFEKAAAELITANDAFVVWALQVISADHSAA